jgi:hypothetical protein
MLKPIDGSFHGLGSSTRPRPSYSSPSPSRASSRSTRMAALARRRITPALTLLYVRRSLTKPTEYQATHEPRACGCCVTDGVFGVATSAFLRVPRTFTLSPVASTRSPVASTSYPPPLPTAASCYHNRSSLSSLPVYSPPSCIVGPQDIERTLI